jgi:two-component system LytT family sensor kinase
VKPADAAVPLPGARQVLLWGLAATPVIALLHAAQQVLQSRLQGSPETFWFAWSHLLPLWITLSIGAAAVVPLVRSFPLPQPRPAGAIAAHLIGGLLFPMLTLALLDAVHVAFFGSRFVEHFWWLLGAAYFEQVPVFFAVAGGLHVIRNVREKARLREEALTLRAALADARLAALAQQLRPHFLFNALNAAAMLVRAGERDQAVEVLARLSSLIRELLREHPHELVPLSEEFAFLREYLLLEGVRFGDRLSVDVRLEPALADIGVPFLLLQPVVENALRYGVACRAGTSHLVVEARRTNGHVTVRVEERGDGGRVGAAEQGLGVGLANTRERLRARWGGTASLALEVEPSGNGSLAEVILPA